MPNLSIVGAFAEGACRVTLRLQGGGDSTGGEGRGGGCVQSQEEGFKKREEKCGG